MIDILEISFETALGLLLQDLTEEESVLVWVNFFGPFK